MLMHRIKTNGCPETDERLHLSSLGRNAGHRSNMRQDANGVQLTNKVYPCTKSIPAIKSRHMFPFRAIPFRIYEPLEPARAPMSMPWYPVSAAAASTPSTPVGYTSSNLVPLTARE